MHARFREQRQVLERQLATARTELDGLRIEQGRGTLTAAMAGRVKDMAEGLRSGRWVAADDLLAIVVSDTGTRMDAYLPEADLKEVAAGSRGTFVPDDPDLPSLAVTVTAIDQAAARSLADPAFASTFGGAVAVAGEGQDKTLVPRDTVYKVALGAEEAPYPFRSVRGRVLLDGPARSLATRLWRATLAVLIRESGF
ncbi:MAG: HlyD family secretion protein [Magnetospirillum sp. WYHS-4]